MTTISFKIPSKSDKVFFKLTTSRVIIERGIRKAWFRVGQDLKRTANTEILRKPKSGRTYIIRTPSGRKRRHVASAPGETHANRSGRLRKAIEWRVRGDQLNFGYGIIGGSDSPEYASFVEEGTKRMAARPTLRNSIESNRRNAEQHLAKAVQEEWAR